jgi:hypothetical protein
MIRTVATQFQRHDDATAFKYMIPAISLSSVVSGAPTVRGSATEEQSQLSSYTRRTVNSTHEFEFDQHNWTT